MAIPDPSIATPSKRAVFRWALFLLLLIGLAIAMLFLPRIFAELQYPLEYESLIVKEATEHDLDPFLVAAVIYSESRFKPQATSPVGARGLMQLMPQTAQGIARRIGEANFSVDKLYDPALNVKFGTYHLQGLMGRYDSDLAPAIVAYNGGGGAGDRYQAGERDGSVPRESLTYVKRVLEAKAKYEELYPARLASGQALQAFLEPNTAPEPPFNTLLRAVQSAVANRINQ